MTEEEKKEFEQLIDEITFDLFPDEVHEFALIKRSYLDEYYSSGSINLKIDKEKGQFQWGDDNNIIFKSVELLLQFLNVLTQFLRIKKERKVNLTDIQDVWEKDLINIGISKEKARVISSKYSKKIFKIILDDKLKQKE